MQRDHSLREADLWKTGPHSSHFGRGDGLDDEGFNVEEEDLLCWDSSIRPGAWHLALVVVAVAAVILVTGPLFGVAKLFESTRVPPSNLDEASPSMVASGLANAMFPNRPRGTIAMAVQAIDPGAASVLTEAVRRFSHNVSARAAVDPRTRFLSPLVAGYYLDAFGYEADEQTRRDAFVSDDELMTLLVLQASKALPGWWGWDGIKAFLNEFCANPPPGTRLLVTGMPPIMYGGGCFGAPDAVGQGSSIESLTQAEMKTIPLAVLIIYYLVRSFRLMVVPLLALVVSFFLASFGVVRATTWFYVPVDVPPAMISVAIALCLDYSLFFLARFREQLLESWPLQRNVDTLVRCTGQTISVSGLLIAIAFFGAIVLPEENLRGAGVAMGVTTVACLTTCVCLIPAVLLVAGNALTKPTFLHQWVQQASGIDVTSVDEEACGLVDASMQSRPARPHAGGWAWLMQLIAQRPRVSFCLVLMLMSPVLVHLPQLHLSADLFVHTPLESPSMLALREINKKFPMGFIDPFTVVVEAPAEPSQVDFEAALRMEAEKEGLSPEVTSMVMARLHKYQDGGKMDPSMAAAAIAGLTSGVSKYRKGGNTDILSSAISAAIDAGASPEAVAKMASASAAILFHDVGNVGAKTGSTSKSAVDYVSDAAKDEAKKLQLSFHVEDPGFTAAAAAGAAASYNALSGAAPADVLGKAFAAAHQAAGRGASDHEIADAVGGSVAALTRQDIAAHVAAAAAKAAEQTGSEPSEHQGILATAAAGVAASAAKAQGLSDVEALQVASHAAMAVGASSEQLACAVSATAAAAGMKGMETQPSDADLAVAAAGLRAGPEKLKGGSDVAVLRGAVDAALATTSSSSEVASAVGATTAVLGDPRLVASIASAIGYMRPSGEEQASVAAGHSNQYAPWLQKNTEKALVPAAVAGAVAAMDKAMGRSDAYALSAAVDAASAAQASQDGMVRSVGAAAYVIYGHLDAAKIGRQGQPLNAKDIIGDATAVKAKALKLGMKKELAVKLQDAVGAGAHDERPDDADLAARAAAAAGAVVGLGFLHGDSDARSFTAATYAAKSVGAHPIDMVRAVDASKAIFKNPELVSMIKSTAVHNFDSNSTLRAAAAAGASSSVAYHRGRSAKEAMEVAVYSAVEAGGRQTDIAPAVGAATALLATSHGWHLSSGASDAAKQKALSLGLSKTEAQEVKSAAEAGARGAPMDPMVMASAAAGSAVALGKLQGLKDAEAIAHGVHASRTFASSGGAAVHEADVAKAIAATAAAMANSKVNDFGITDSGTLAKDLESEASKIREAASVPQGDSSKDGQAGVVKDEAVDAVQSEARKIHGVDSKDATALSKQVVEKVSTASPGEQDAQKAAHSEALKIPGMSLEDTNELSDEASKLAGGPAAKAVHAFTGSPVHSDSASKAEHAKVSTLAANAIAGSAAGRLLAQKNERFDSSKIHKATAGIEADNASLDENTSHIISSVLGTVGKKAADPQAQRTAVGLKKYPELAASAEALYVRGNGSLLTPGGYAAMGDLCERLKQQAGSIATMLGPVYVMNRPVDWFEAVVLNTSLTPLGLRTAHGKMLDMFANKRYALIQVHPTFPASGAGGADWVLRARDVITEWETAHPGWFAGVAGSAALKADERGMVLRSLCKYFAISVSVIMVVVFLAFGSIVLAARLAAALLLTIAATYSGAVIIYQTPLLHGIWPWLADYNGLTYEVVAIATCLCVALGLDYDIFLVSRIVEYRMRGFTDRASIVMGVSKTGGIISGAGLIMSLAFSGLCFSDKVLLQQFGVLLIISVLFDTFVVRTVLVPALMLSARGANWWPRKMPPPTVDALEGELLTQDTLESRASSLDDVSQDELLRDTLPPL